MLCARPRRCVNLADVGLIIEGAGGPEPLASGHILINAVNPLLSPAACGVLQGRQRAQPDDSPFLGEGATFPCPCARLPTASLSLVPRPSSLVCCLLSPLACALALAWPFFSPKSSQAPPRYALFMHARNVIFDRFPAFIYFLGFFCLTRLFFTPPTLLPCFCEGPKPREEACAWGFWPHFLPAVGRRRAGRGGFFFCGV